MRLLRRPAVQFVLAGTVLAIGALALLQSTRLLGAAADVRSVKFTNLRPLVEPSRVYDAYGNLIAVLQYNDYRVPVAIAQISPWAQRAVVDVEDSSFYYHGAVNGRSVFRALRADVTAGHIVEGGSTITQQLIKISDLNPQRTFTRKVREMVLAFQLENHMTKDQILERYLNTVYFGHGAYGVAAAAYIYFGQVGAGHLDPAQSALLAGMIRNPSANDPLHHPQQALTARNNALESMVTNHHLTQAQANLYKLVPLPKSVNAPPTNNASKAVQAYVEDVKWYLCSGFGSFRLFPMLGKTYDACVHKLSTGGLTITTALDQNMEAKAVRAVEDRPHLEAQAALVAIDPTTGFVRALVPGNPGALPDNAGSPLGWDLVTGRYTRGRSPGSSFKPVVLMAALDSGHSPNDVIDGTSPCYFKGYTDDQGNPFAGRNAEPGGGPMSLDQSTYESVNCAYMRLGKVIGLDKVVDMARRLSPATYGGVGTMTFPKSPGVSVSIGTSGESPLSMASAYATIADDGIYHHPGLVTRIADQEGNVIYLDADHGTRVVPAQEARVATWMLGHVLTQGTGSGLGLDRPAAGKTGTATADPNDASLTTDGWFIGYTPQLCTAVWAGYPGTEQQGWHGQFGASLAGPVWQEFMHDALSGQPVLNFTDPDFSQIPSGQLIDTSSFSYSPNEPANQGPPPFNPGAGGPAPGPAVPPGRRSNPPGSPPSSEPTPTTAPPTSAPPATSPPTTG